MINAVRTGAYISSLRKARDWTQQQLAEKLLVTHQAVSQWEKGATFPDIGLLPQLAQLLGVSVDALLHGEPRGTPKSISGGALVEELARGNAGEVARMVRADPDGIDLMIEAAPLVRPSQLNEVVGGLAGIPFSLAQIMELAPFVSQVALQALLEQVGTADIEPAMLANLAPFVGREALDELVQRVTPGGVDAELLKQLAPFVSQAVLAKLAAPLLESRQPLQPDLLGNLAPFIGRTLLDGLLDRLPAQMLNIELVIEMAPFASRDALDRLLGRLEHPAAVGQHLHELAPFLSRAALQQAVVQNIGSLTAADIVELAPFLDRDSLQGLIRKGVKA